MDHPHPDKKHVVKCMRHYILGMKKTFSTGKLPNPGEPRIPRRGARSLVHYNDLIQTYLTAKRANTK